MEPPSPYTAEDFCETILSRYATSSKESDKHICTTIASISQTLREEEQNHNPLITLTPTSYLVATCASLSSSSADPSPPSHLVHSLLSILSLLLPVLPRPVIIKKADYLSELVFKALRSRSVTPEAAAAALRCFGCVSASMEKVTWQGTLPDLFGFVLTCATDHSPKVRKQAHICLYDVLNSFRRTPVLLPASEAIIKVFERLLLLAGGSNTSASETPKGGAQEVLFLLDALTDSLSLLSPKFANTILKYFKSLLELKQPVVTKRITSCLSSVCRYPTLEVSPEVLLDLLCLLSVSISADEMSPDDMTFSARLLDIGTKKVYSVNQQLCGVKLPLVFNALADMLVSEHEAALFAATEALKSLIHECIDENLIKQGIDQIRGSAYKSIRKSGPTVVEKLCATVDNLLYYRYSAVWDMSFQVASALFENLGENSSYLMKGTLQNLANMQKLSDEDFPYRKQLHECLGSALASMGPETFLSILPLKLESEDLSQANDWLFPILKQYTIGARLSFFTESIIPMIRSVRRRSQMLEREGKVYSSRSVTGLIYSLWSLLPSFCNYPLDTSESFKDLEREIFRALREEQDVRGIICSALQILIQQNKKIVDGTHNLPEIEINKSIKQAVERYTTEVASNNLSILRSSAREFLSLLSGLYMQSPTDTGGSLQTTISQFASISDKEVITRFFKTTMQKLLKATQEANKKVEQSKSEMQIDNSSNESSASLARAQLLDLVVALLPGLDSKEIDLLFIVIDPALKDADGLVQKKAYKVLSTILKNCDEFLSKNVEKLLDLMINVLPSCHCSAKRPRLDCLYFLIVHISRGELEQRRRDVVSSFLTEIILSLKEANKKTRTRAYDMIVEIGHACGDEEKGGKPENLLQFFSMVAGGLAGESPHMISAAVTGLARLAYEFSDLISAAYSVLPSTFLLLRRKNKEILKASLGLLKVLVAKSQAEGLEVHLRSIVEGLLMWQDGTKNHFKAKVKYLLEMLVKKCGLDAVKSVMPEDHMKLLTNIRKIKERKERGTSVISEDAKSHRSKATTSRMSKWNHTKIFSEFGDEESDSEVEYMESKTLPDRRSKTSALMTTKSTSIRNKRSREASKSLQEDSFDQLDDEPLDLLDRQRTRSSLRSSSQHSGRKADLDDEPEIDLDGRLIIREDGDKKPKREKSPDLDSDKKSQAGSHSSLNSQRGRKRKKISEESGGWAYTGKEYASKKASGDVKRKGKLEPYAYWPLDRKMMSRRPEQRAAARKGMSSVIKMAKGLEGRSVASALSVKGMKVKKYKKKTFKKNKN